ncbi:MAG: NfeD family protein [Chloroflexota bacterium]
MGKQEMAKRTPLKALVLLLDEVFIAAIVIVILWKAGVPLLPWAPVGVLAFLGAGYWLGYKLLVSSSSKGVGIGEEGMIGLTGVTVTSLSPEGSVKIRGELWKARAGDKSIGAGEEIEVEDVEGLKLVVRRRHEGKVGD